MNEISALFDNLYNKFLLRDIFAKIMPGFIVIFSVLYFFQGSVKKIICLLGNLSTWQWLLLPLAWIVGFILQHLGIMRKWLKDPTYSFWKSKSEEGLKKRFDEKVRISVNNEKEYCKLLERAIVIKEACGNTFMALIFAGIFYSTGQVRTLIAGELGISICQWAVHLIIILILLTISICVLKESHDFQSMREEQLRASYEKLRRDGQHPLSVPR